MSLDEPRAHEDSSVAPAPGAPGGSATVNSVDDIVADEVSPHEGIPHGVPESYDWQRMPHVRLRKLPEGFLAITGWGQVYQDATLARAANVRVEIRHLRTYLLTTGDDTWHRVQNPTALRGAAYREDFRAEDGDATMPADTRLERDGISVSLSPGRNYHFYPSDRASIDPEHVRGVFVTVEARLIVDDPSKPDDRNRARLLLSVGADVYKNRTVPFSPSVNRGVGVGRMKYVTRRWRSFNMITIPPTEIRSTPPPID